jgi:hypothetical protein
MDLQNQIFKKNCLKSENSQNIKIMYIQTNSK